MLFSLPSFNTGMIPKQSLRLALGITSSRRCLSPVLQRLGWVPLLCASSYRILTLKFLFFLSFPLDGSSLKVGTMVIHLWFPSILDFLACNRCSIKAWWVKANSIKKAPKRHYNHSHASLNCRCSKFTCSFVLPTNISCGPILYPASCFWFGNYSVSASKGSPYFCSWSHDEIQRPSTPVPTEPHEPKSSLLGSEVLSPSPEKVLEHSAFK